MKKINDEQQKKQNHIHDFVDKTGRIVGVSALIGFTLLGSGISTNANASDKTGINPTDTHAKYSVWDEADQTRCGIHICGCNLAVRMTE